MTSIWIVDLLAHYLSRGIITASKNIEVLQSDDEPAHSVPEPMILVLVNGVDVCRRFEAHVELCEHFYCLIIITLNHSVGPPLYS